MLYIRLGLYFALGIFVAVVTDKITFKSKLDKFTFRVSMSGIVWVIDMLNNLPYAKL